MSSSPGEAPRLTRPPDGVTTFVPMSKCSGHSCTVAGSAEPPRPAAEHPIEGSGAEREPVGQEDGRLGVDGQRVVEITERRGIGPRRERRLGIGAGEGDQLPQRRAVDGRRACQRTAVPYEHPLGNSQRLRPVPESRRGRSHRDWPAARTVRSPRGVAGRARPRPPRCQGPARVQQSALSVGSSSIRRHPLIRGPGPARGPGVP